MQMNVFNEYTYFLEMIIQAGQRGWRLPLYQSERTGIYDLALVKTFPPIFSARPYIFMLYKLRFFMFLIIPSGFVWAALVAVLTYSKNACTEPDSGSDSDFNRLSAVDVGLVADLIKQPMEVACAAAVGWIPQKGTVLGHEWLLRR